MKKLILPLLVVSSSLLINCVKDDANDLVNALTTDHLAPLVGNWESTLFVISGCTDPEQNESMSCTDGPCLELTINSNGTYSFVNHDEDPVETESGTIEVTATTFIACPTGETDCSPDSYTLVGDVLTVSFDEDDSPGCTFTITFIRV